MRVIALTILLVVSAGLSMSGKRRPFTAEEVWTFVAMLVWIAADIAIGQNFGPDENAKRWTARLVVFLLLMSDYVVLRSPQVAVVETQEAETFVEVDKTIVIRERDKV